ncbi:hypothetical protein [Kitasatospora sp. NPDC093102]|uniref:hypothetical protein n=1 Tax=Kitasatospora sp. NPDC093102 TaxID=3155069 RepID=UPI003429556F
MRIDEPLLWRRMGWVRVRMNVAGQDAAGGSLLLPVAPRAQALALLGRLWPGGWTWTQSPWPRHRGGPASSRRSGRLGRASGWTRRSWSVAGD